MEQKQQSSEKGTHDSSNILIIIWGFVRDIFNLQEDQESEYKTIDTIRRSIEFKGTNLWIFICAIFIASIGLNVNSTAVIIGAMLVSPLMGPIMGVGISVGINDFLFFKKSFKNLGIMTAVGIITSALYFYLSPIDGATSELLSRTYPTIYDVLIATFGGFAGIIAGSRIEKGNAIPGVAIATALMPPLATVGYGVATVNWEFFVGALYLYLINCTFICISTLIFVRWMKFPKKEFINESKEKRTSRIIGFITLLIALPSVFLAYNLIVESTFEQNAKRFIVQEIENKGYSVIAKKINYDRDSSIVEITVFGANIDSIQQLSLKEKMPFYNLHNAYLLIHQSSKQYSIDYNKLNTELRANFLENLYDKNAEVLENKDKQIALLEKELLSLKKSSIPINNIYQELVSFHPTVDGISLGQTITHNKNTQENDTLFMCILNTKSKKRMSDDGVKRIQIWLKTRLQQDSVVVLQR